jgi:hypothetical protein
MKFIKSNVKIKMGKKNFKNAANHSQKKLNISKIKDERNIMK